MPTKIARPKEPFTIHVRGKAKMSVWDRISNAFLLLIGKDIVWAFCNTIEARFSSEGEFLGLDYLGSVPQIVFGNAKTCDIELIDPNYHLVIEGENNGNSGTSS